MEETETRTEKQQKTTSYVHTHIKKRKKNTADKKFKERMKKMFTSVCDFIVTDRKIDR